MHLCALAACPAVLPGALAIPLMEQAVEVAGVLVAHLGNDLLDVQIAAAQQPRRGLAAQANNREIGRSGDQAMPAAWRSAW